MPGIARAWKGVAGAFLKSGRPQEILAAESIGGMFSFWRKRGLPPPADQLRRKAAEKYVGWVATCVNMLVNAATAVPLRLYAAETKGGRVRAQGIEIGHGAVAELKSRPWAARHKALRSADNVVEIVEHPLLDLLQNVNDAENHLDLIDQTVIWLSLIGDAYWYLGGMENNSVSGQPTDIFVLDASLVKIAFDDNNEIVFLYGREGDNQKRYMQRQIIHFRKAGPASPLYGSGALEQQRWGLYRQEKIDESETATLAALGRPDILIKYLSGTLTKSQRRQLEREWNQIFSGRVRQHAKVIDSNFELEKLGWAPKDMNYPQGRLWTLKELASGFGIPIGLLETRDVNKANAEVAERIFAKYTVRPLLWRLEQKLNERLTPLYDDRLFLAFDDPVPENREARLQETDTLLRNFVLTINEARLRYGLEPVPWGDEPLVPLNLAPLGSPMPEPQKSRPAVITSSTVRAKAGELTDGSSGGAKNIRTEIITITEKMTALLAEIGEAAAGRVEDVVVGGQAFEASAWTDKIADALQDGMILSITRAVGTERRRLADMIRRRRSYKADAFDISLLQSVDNTEIIEAAKKLSLITAEHVAKTLQKTLHRQIIEGIKAGEAADQIRKRILEDAKGAVGKRKAETIARTETARAYTRGQHLTWEKSGIVTRKVWSAVGDACPFCQALDGKVIEIDKVYYGEGESIEAEWNGEVLSLDVGMDVEGPPLHPNCRCAIVPEID